MAQPKEKIVPLAPAAVGAEVIVCAPTTTGARQRIMSFVGESSAAVTVALNDGVGGTNKANIFFPAAGSSVRYDFFTNPPTEFGMGGLLLSGTNTTGLSALSSGAANLSGYFIVLEE